MISVIIPVYNKEKYIMESIESVLNQTYKNFELILVNDGSTDRSLYMAQSIVDKRIRIINIINSGVSVARNTGIDKAKYDFIAFLDADDWWGKTFLEEIVRLIKSYPKHNVFATGRCRVFENEIDIYQNEYLPNIGEVGLLDYYQIISKYLPPINSSNVVIEKDLLFSAGLFNLGQKQHEDHDLWLRVCANNEIVFVNKNLSYYRKDIDNSASHNYYHPEDFLKYLETIGKTKNVLSNRRKKYFEKYYNKFIVLTFIQNYKFYSKEQNLLVSHKIKNIIELPYWIIILFLNRLPYKNTYDLLKKIKGNG